MSPGRLIRLAATLAIGAAGGYLFVQIGSPLPWMLGAMAVTTLLAFAGAPVFVPGLFRRLMMAILGVMLGSAFTPDVIEHAATWLATIAGMTTYTLVGMTLMTLYLRRVGKLDPATAFFSAAPGGFSEMVVLGPALGADDRIITLIHATRVLLVVMILPLAFRIFAGYVPPVDLGTGGGFAKIALGDLAMLTLAGLAGLAAGRLLHFPAWHMLGPLLFSATIHLLGWTKARPPFELVAFAQVILGCGVGARFAGVRWRELLHPIGLSSVATLGLLLLAVAFAEALAVLTGIDFQAVLLSYAPGGFAEMNLIALSLGIEVAFISTHHVCRLILVVSAAAFLSRFFWSKRMPPVPKPGE